MMKGFFVSDLMNGDQVTNYIGEIVFCCGLRAYDHAGNGVHNPPIVLDSLYAPIKAINSEGNVPVFLGPRAGSVWMHSDKLEISGTVDITKNSSPITPSWTLVFNDGAHSLVSEKEGLERKLRSRCSVVDVLDDHVFLLNTYKIDSEKSKIGVYDAQKNKWRYSVKLKGRTAIASGQYLLEKLDSEVLIRQFVDGKVISQITGVVGSFVKKCLFVDQCIAVQTEKAVYSLNISTNEQKQIFFKDFGSDNYSLSLKPDGLVVFFHDDEIARVYDLASLEFQDFKMSLDNICDDFNDYIVVDRVGELLSFVKLVRSEFESTGRFLRVRYFYNTNESPKYGNGTELLKARCIPIEVEHGLRDYKLHFDRSTDFDTFYRQAVSYIEAISLEYGYAIGTDEPHDEIWTGHLIVDTADQKFSDENYSELKKLLAYIELKLIDIAKPTIGKNPKIKLILK